MYTVLINAAIALALTLGLRLGYVCGWGWSVAWGMLLMIGLQVLSSWIIQKRVKAAMSDVQQILLDGQKKLQAKVNRWQTRPPGSVKQAQLEIEHDQQALVKRALEKSKCMECFVPWVPMMTRQIATMRLQLYWMIKDFKQVDELMPKALMVDPLMAAMKLARMYMLNQFDGMDKFFRKQTLRLRYGQGALLYALYSWILVQRKDYDSAHKVLIQANDKMENVTIKANREALANNRIQQFSNAGLGEQWYALHLEQPKVKTQRPSHFSQRHF
ncbi:MAG: hypothetical protein IJU44_02310 [Kiritimatiellae bacterium]|nr:hypothetical protein [Kiritimatiellia bacterium]